MRSSPPRPRPDEMTGDDPPMLKQIEGSKAMARTIALCRPQVVCAYPITPQTHIVEGLGELDPPAASSKTASSSTSRASSRRSRSPSAPRRPGARAYTATASQGLLFMAEAVYNAAGLGLPIVMTLGNRAIGAPINIWNDHSDAMALRESGWIQLFAETNQEAADLHIVAFRLAEELSVPDDGLRRRLHPHPRRRAHRHSRPGGGRRIPAALRADAEPRSRPIRSRSARWSGRTPSPKCATCNITSSTRRSP